jgi:hypothetical protein
MNGGYDKNDADRVDAIKSKPLNCEIQVGDFWETVLYS